MPAGYQVLTRSPEIGVDLFIKPGPAPALFFQGHPEYAAETLLREYLRDVGRFLRGEQELHPAPPSGYFDDGTLQVLGDLAAQRRRRSRPGPNRRLCARDRGRGPERRLAALGGRHLPRLARADRRAQGRARRDVGRPRAMTARMVETLATGADTAAIAVSIVILTQRRPGPLACAVRSALAQTGLAAIQIELVVVDNDATPSARTGLAGLAADAPFPVRYVRTSRQAASPMRATLASPPRAARSSPSSTTTRKRQADGSPP